VEAEMTISEFRERVKTWYRWMFSPDTIRRAFRGEPPQAPELEKFLQGADELFPQMTRLIETQPTVWEKLLALLYEAGVEHAVGSSGAFQKAFLTIVPPSCAEEVLFFSRVMFEAIESVFTEMSDADKHELLLAFAGNVFCPDCGGVAPHYQTTITPEEMMNAAVPIIDKMIDNVVAIPRQSKEPSK
jgi:hypothetical protein